MKFLLGFAFFLGLVVCESCSGAEFPTIWPAARCPNGQCGTATGPEMEKGTAKQDAPAAARTTKKFRRVVRWRIK